MLSCGSKYTRKKEGICKSGASKVIITGWYCGVCVCVGGDIFLSYHVYMYTHRTHYIDKIIIITNLTMVAPVARATRLLSDFLNRLKAVMLARTKYS